MIRKSALHVAERNVIHLARYAVCCMVNEGRGEGVDDSLKLLVSAVNRLDDIEHPEPEWDDEQHSAAHPEPDASAGDDEAIADLVVDLSRTSKGSLTVPRQTLERLLAMVHAAESKLAEREAEVAALPAAPRPSSGEGKP